FHSVLKHLGVVRCNGVTTDRIHRRRKGDGLAVNGKHRLVTGISGNLFNVLVVIPKRHAKEIHLDAQALLKQLLGSDYFILHPLFILWSDQFRPRPFSAGISYHYSMALAQVLMRRGMRLNVHSIVAHVGKLFPSDCLAAAYAATAHAFGVRG